MSLADYQVRTEEVSLGGGQSFTVRGLSLSDITTLVNSFRSELGEIFETFEEKGDVLLEDMAQIAEKFLGKFPDLVATAIALAADEPGEAEKVKRLPAAVIVDAVEKAGRLTFEAEGGLKKVLATVVKMATGTQTLVADLGAPGSAGSQQKTEA